jgi:ferrous iron transport protein B
MMDEAERKGIWIDLQKLSEILGIPVAPTMAITGKGLRELFLQVFRVEEEKKRGKHIPFSRDVEITLQSLSAQNLPRLSLCGKLPPRFMAIKLMENDPDFRNLISSLPALQEQVQLLQKSLEDAHGVAAEEVMSSERHALALNLFEKSTKILHPPQRDIRNLIDRWVMNRFGGYAILFAVFLAFFNLVFGLGGTLEEPLLNFFHRWMEEIQGLWGTKDISLILLLGCLQGIAGGIAIVLPYLVPFLLGLSLLEDVGYLPRVAFLMDTFMHRLGLHGKSIIPLILGYGCTVPAIMATRILELPRHRFVVSLMTTMIPCSARITIIFGLVAFYIGPNAALGIFAMNLLVVAGLGKVLSILYPEVNQGLILEIPPFQVPHLKISVKKTWYRIREFIVVAWPLLIVGSVVLSLMEFAQIDQYLNVWVSPLTSLLGLPQAVGTTLLFGLLRKELAMIMLAQALGTSEILTVMTKTQVLVFTVFVIFYIPCLATIAALWKEVGKRGAILTVLFTLLVAITLGLLTRLGMGVLGG